MKSLILRAGSLAARAGSLLVGDQCGPCACDGGDTNPDLPCDVPELPCSAFVAVQGVTAATPVFGVDQRIDVLAFSGINGIHKVNLDGSQDLGPLPVHIVIRITRLSNPSERVTLVFTRGAVSAETFFCIDDRLCLGGGSIGFNSLVPTSVIDESNGFWNWSAQGYLINGTAIIVSANAEGQGPLCIGSAQSDVRPPADGQIFGDRAGTMALVGWGFNCPPDEEYSSVRLAYPCGDGDPIPVDIATNTEGRINARYQDTIYIVGDETTTQPPVDVDWVNDECETDPIDSSVWERCRQTGTLPIPPKVRCDSPNVQGADFMYSVFVFPTPTASHPECQTVYYIAYRKVFDDGAPYPSVSGSPRQGPCDTMIDNGYRRFCPNPDDAGDPQDPNDPAITDPGGRRPRGLPLIDLDGHDIETEAMAAKQGGCCGQPSRV